MRALLLILLGLAIGAVGAGYAVNAWNARNPLPGAVMTVMDYHLESLEHAAKGGRCDAAASLAQLDRLKATAGDIPAAFPGIEQHFLDAAERLSHALQTATQAAPADCAALTAALKPVGEACENCHQQYR